ncbi:type II toxin-antitoxin system VapB family antitoxin [Candidatus Acetothermia bacterium]|nr:type II toxin-antitoxin system VapB family antitoxin [Candidatus Acetothermia bacterium]MCI2432158.1 type II toxin-antitoxin system VapB family antitoxin [Candidatus Acetothermia bacterium]MCI2436149.1 type II toxin-antitoxin system VapB family antitoxin [Candidatus Acetothermia bacterium]
MRTTIDLEEDLLHEAMKLLGATTKREVVRQALHTIIAQKRQERLRAKLGQMKLTLTREQLDEMRRDE